MQPHAFQPTAPGSSLCGFPGCLSPRLALIHAEQQVRDNPCLSAEDITPWDDPVPPFPSEPAPGSPEAVAMAAETIQGLLRSKEAELLRERGEDIADRDWNRLSLALTAVRTLLPRATRIEDDLVTQRDALADALESLRAADCWTDTYCEFCQSHAPKKENGVPCGPIPHFEECARAEAEAALRKAGR